MTLNFLRFIPVLPLTMLAFITPAHANKTVDAPYVDGGDAYLEWKGGYDIDDTKAVDGGWVQETNVGYGITDWWNFEVGGAFERSGLSDDNTKFSTLTIDNRFNLTTPGEYFVDFGFSVAYGIGTQHGGADGIEGKLLFAKEVGKFSNLANIIIGHEVGDNAPHDADTTYGFAWSTSYPITETFAAGLEWYSDVGNFEDKWDDQSHQFGPVVYGEFGNGFGYEAGALFGVSDAAQDTQLKAVLNYSFPIDNK